MTTRTNTRSSVPPDTLLGDNAQARGEQFVGWLRLVIAALSVALVFGYFSHIQEDLRQSLSIIGIIALSWGFAGLALLYVLYRGAYRQWVSYLSITLDILAVSCCQIAPIPENPFNLINGPIYSFYFVMIGFAALRNNRKFVLYAGFSAALQHILLSIYIFYQYLPSGYGTADFGNWTIGVSFLDEVVRVLILIVTSGIYGYVTRELRESERHYQDLFENIPDGIIIASKEGRIQAVNRRFANMVNVSSDELIGRRLNDYLRLDPIPAEANKGAETIESPGRLICADGSDMHVRTATVPVNSGGGKFIEMSIRDVTDQFQLERQLVQSQKMETLGRLAGGLAHDFNNILGGILGATSLLDRGVKRLDENSARNRMISQISIIRDCGERARDVVSRLMTFSRNKSMETMPIDLGQVISGVVSICSNTFGARIDIVVEGMDNTVPPVAEGDATSLTQALLNLCINAKDAMQNGGRMTVRLSEVLPSPQNASIHPDASGDEVYWCISVEDDGVGIATEDMSRIFDPFFTTKPIGEGTGLGLAMVYNIARDHGGFTTVESQIGEGTTFSLYLPQGRPSRIPSNPPETDLPTGDAVILVVDDEEVVRSSVAGMLIELGYTAITASNGETALEIYADKQNSIDLVVLDIVMPRMDGSEVLRRLRKMNPSLKVIVASGYIEEERANILNNMNVNGYIRKPFALPLLAYTVSDVLQS